jgi:hypothetical protein
MGLDLSDKTVQIGLVVGAGLLAYYMLGQKSSSCCSGGGTCGASSANAGEESAGGGSSDAVNGKGQKCSHCGKAGHNIRSCDSKVKYSQSSRA